MDSRTKSILTDNLKRLREVHEYTLDDVAAAIGMSEPSVSKYENGIVEPSLQTIDKICDLYQIAIADLFTPKGAADKAFSLKATEDHLLEAMNRKLYPAGIKFVRVKK